MKIVEKETKLNVEMGEFETRRTGRVGYLPEDVAYNDIVKVFGNPRLIDHKKYPHATSQAEWSGKINGHLFTIYDHKIDKNYRENKDWHIGGLEDVTAELVNLYFKSNK